MSKGDWSWIPEEAKNRWGYTVAELAGWLGVKRQVVDNWVRGRNDPDIIFSDAQALYHNAIEIFEKSEDTPMQHICLLGLSYIRLFEESQKPDPNFKEVLAVFVAIDASRPESYELHQEVTEELALAEALRLSGYLSQALSRYQSVKDTSTRYGYRLEKAHALIGIAATKAMNTEVDRESCNKALEIYGAVGSKWGEVQALITRAIMEFGIGGSGSEYLREASRIKEEISLAPQGKLIEELSKIGFDARERYVFLFV